jgi:arsenate reductase
MEALAAAGQNARQVDYILTPPSRDELKRLSAMLREANQSLARRYEPLFMELQLDDRFISENEFLTGIFEHPTLINGPILVSSGKARICRSAEDVHAFLGNGASDEKRPKGISARMVAMMLGRAVPPPVEKETQKAEAPARPAVSESPEPISMLKPKAVKLAVPLKKPVAKVVKAKAAKPKAPAKVTKKTRK